MKSYRCLRAFTLIELLVVMGIIGLLVALLFPAITHAITVVQIGQTKQTINRIEFSLQAFKSMYGAYPPSNKSQRTTFAGQEIQGDNKGAENLSKCLLSDDNPGGKPLFEADTALSGGGGLNDSFNPGKAIYYYRAYEDAAVDRFQARDCGVDGSNPQKGFKDQTHFEILVQYKDPSGRDHWARDDYLLISSGPDRAWGFVKAAGNAGTLQFALANEIDKWCDDVCNFEVPKK